MCKLVPKTHGVELFRFRKILLNGCYNVQGYRRKLNFDKQLTSWKVTARNAEARDLTFITYFIEHTFNINIKTKYTYKLIESM